jgi:Spy/CpxP family protein refolding chaperone
MKTVLISVILAALVSFGMSRWFSRQPAVNLHDAGWLQRVLRLAPDQTAQINKLAEEYRAAVNASCLKHCDARLGLSEILAQPTVDLPAADNAVGKMCAAANEVERATLQHILRVREVLTPDQRVRYAALINQQLCNMYPPAQP